MSAYTVFVLCAEWCGVCREFRAQWPGAAADRAGHRYVWIDIEDEADRVGEIDVETFPTIAILRDGAPFFYGATLPTMQAVSRLLNPDLAPFPLDEEQLEWVARLAREYAAGEQ